MKKTTFNWILRAWIGLASLGAFTTGFVAFSHAAKPSGLAGASNASSAEGQFAPIPTLAPLPAVGSGTNSSSVQPLQSQPSQAFVQPRFRTRGS
jgi:hypothetical protein